MTSDNVFSDWLTSQVTFFNECFENDTPLAREMQLEGVSFERRWNINVCMYQDGYRVVDIIDNI
jgi:hypothetical protein